MTSQFNEMILRMEAEIQALKSVTRRPGDTLGTYTATFNITPSIKGKTSGGTKTSQANQNAVIAIDTHGEAAICSFSMSSAVDGRSFLQYNRALDFDGSSTNPDGLDWTMIFSVTKGNATDDAELDGNSSNTKTIPISVTITCTSVFDATITYENA